MALVNQKIMTSPFQEVPSNPDMEKGRGIGYID
jgi:hypothetical protein